MIPYSDFRRLITSVCDFGDLDQYIAECGGSVPVGSAEEAIRILTAVWTMAHDGLTIRSIADACGLSMLSLCKHLDISRRTVGDWSTGQRNPPAWQLPLIAYAAMSYTLTEE